MNVDDINPGISVDLGEGKLAREEIRRLLAMKETSEFIAAAFFVVVAALALPAVLSAAGKIGIHTGRLMLGTIGGKERLGANVVGDRANLAARVEGMTKLYGATVLISDATFAALPPGLPWNIRELDRVRAKGKREPITINEVSVPPAMGGPSPFAEALEAFRAGDLPRARELFAHCQGHRAAELYVQRCDALAASGLPDGWSGVTDLQTK